MKIYKKHQLSARRGAVIVTRVPKWNDSLGGYEVWDRAEAKNCKKELVYQPAPTTLRELAVLLERGYSVRMKDEHAPDGRQETGVHSLKSGIVIER